jgi:hypothetical protein
MLVYRRLPPQLLLVPIYTPGLRVGLSVLNAGHIETECDLAEIRTQNLVLQSAALGYYTTALFGINELLSNKSTYMYSLSISKMTL